MLQIKIIRLKLILVFSIALNCLLFGQSAIEPPMYGSRPWSKKQISANEKLIVTSLKEYGNLKEASVKISKLGRKSFTNEDLSTAMHYFNQAWILDSVNCIPYYGFAMIIQVTQQEASAKKYLDMGKKLDSLSDGLVKYYGDLGYYVGKKGNIQKEIELLKITLSIDSSDIYSYSRLANIFIGLNDSINALVYLNTAIRRNPNDSVSYLNKGWLYYVFKAYDKALLNYSYAIEVAPFYTKAYINKAGTELNLGLFKEAISDYDKVLKLLPENSQAKYYKLRGGAKIQSNDKEGGCQDLYKCINLMKKYKEKEIEAIKLVIQETCN